MKSCTTRIGRRKANSTGRRNTSGGWRWPVVRRQQLADRALRPAMRSPGRPIPARHVEREFWRLIARGMSTEDAAVGVGVSALSRHAGFARLAG